MIKSNHAYSYIQGGGDDQGCYPSMLDCCGNSVGVIKTWLPCIGCLFCCFSNPFKQVQQGNHGIVSRFGRYVKTVPPGLVYINPMTETLVEVDTRIRVLDLQKQTILTKDNINLVVDTCVYYTVIDPCFSQYRLENSVECVKQLTYASIKNTAGIFTFQQLLEKRNDIANDIELQVEPIVLNWGIKINQIYFKDFEIDAGLQNELNSASRARREAEASIITAKADVDIAKMLSERSKLLDSNTAMQIRYLETIKQMANKDSCKLIYTPGHH